MTDIDVLPKNPTKQFISMILKLMPIELLVELEKLTVRHDINNNQKSSMILKMLYDNNINAASLGTGTNRYGVKIDGYVFKIALDRLGKIDNRREFKYTKQLQPYVIRVYECLPTGLISVCEYIESFVDLNEFRECEDDIRKALTILTDQFLIGDIGITSKNFKNWGFRMNGDTKDIVCLDFAYIYSTSYSTFQCNCKDEAILVYTPDFCNLKCPACGRVTSFAQIRRKISRDAEEAEIGDIRDISYVMTSPIEEHIIDLAKSPVKIKDKKPKKARPWEDLEPDCEITQEEQLELIERNKL